MTLKQYYHALNRHDWYFYDSDDPAVRRKGQLDRDNLVEFARLKGKKFVEMFNAFHKHMFSGLPWGDETQHPKPEEPK